MSCPFPHCTKAEVPRRQARHPALYAIARIRQADVHHRRSLRLCRMPRFDARPAWRTLALPHGWHVVCALHNHGNRMSRLLTAQKSEAVTSVVPRHGVLVLNGYGIRVQVNAGHLLLHDGIADDRRTIRLPRVNHGPKEAGNDW